MNILFVCRHNRFRSRVAEAYFKKINKNKSLKVKSAGIFIGSYPLLKRQVIVAKKLGLKIGGRPKGISTDLLRWQDTIIVITDDLPKGLFNYDVYKNKVLVWKIKDDISGGEDKGTKRIIRRIMRKVKELVKKQEKRK